MLAALAISLLLHAILAGYLRWPGMRLSQEPQNVIVRHITISRIVPPPPRRLPIAPSPKASTVPARTRTTVAPPALLHHGTSGPPSGSGVVPAAHVSTPSPTVTPSPQATAPAGFACVHPNASPAVASSPAPVELPADARTSKANGTAAIAVTLDDQGHVTATRIAQSSGNDALDRAALQMAQDASYAPKLVACKPVAAQYTYTVKFAPW